MLRRLALVVLLVALVAGSADASIYRGRRRRKYCRKQGLVLYMHSDALKIYEKYGYPVHRLRIRGIDSTQERWIYYEAGREFYFDEDQKLVRTKKFFSENKRARIEGNRQSKQKKYRTRGNPRY
ncbi:MAG: hypothetical protein KAU49_07560 [Candidatus Krumholzibacteria bacterium]|nr:hypothetical protein [Candidatus Krumholzibacteria bacterium]